MASFRIRRFSRYDRPCSSQLNCTLSILFFVSEFLNQFVYSEKFLVFLRSVWRNKMSRITKNSTGKTYRTAHSDLSRDDNNNGEMKTNSNASRADNVSSALQSLEQNLNDYLKNRIKKEKISTHKKSVMTSPRGASRSMNQDPIKIKGIKPPAGALKSTVRKVLKAGETSESAAKVAVPEMNAKPIKAILKTSTKQVTSAATAKRSASPAQSRGGAVPKDLKAGGVPKSIVLSAMPEINAKPVKAIPKTSTMQATSAATAKRSASSAQPNREQWVEQLKAYGTLKSAADAHEAKRNAVIRMRRIAAAAVKRSASPAQSRTTGGTVPKVLIAGGAPKSVEIVPMPEINAKPIKAILKTSTMQVTSAAIAERSAKPVQLRTTGGAVPKDLKTGGAPNVVIVPMPEKNAAIDARPKLIAKRTKAIPKTSTANSAATAERSKLWMAEVAGAKTATGSITGTVPPFRRSPQSPQKTQTNYGAMAPQPSVPAPKISTESEKSTASGAVKKEIYSKLVLKRRLSEEMYNKLLALEEASGYIGNDVSFECGICYSTVEPNEGVTLRNCLHQFCAECCVQSIMHSESVIVQCPAVIGVDKCCAAFQDREISALLSPEQMVAYEAKMMTAAEGSTENAFHCRKPNCRAWCELADNLVTVFVCQACDSTNCISCRVSRPFLRSKRPNWRS